MAPWCTRCPQIQSRRGSRVEADQAITVCPWPPGHSTRMIVIDSLAAQIGLRRRSSSGSCSPSPAAAATTRTSPPATTETPTDGDRTDDRHRDRARDRARAGSRDRDAAERRRRHGSPEDGTGGAGDEEPARTLALFTGRAGGSRRAWCACPPFISIRVELRSADGARVRPDVRRRDDQVSGGLASVSTTIDGLRPGAKLVGTPTGARGQVRIEATAEPGP